MEEVCLLLQVYLVSRDQREMADLCLLLTLLVFFVLIFPVRSCRGSLREVFLSAPGVHAFLFVVSFGRFTEQEEDILKKVKGVFGKDVLKHVILLFTYGDECIRERIQAEIDGNSLVSKVIQSCQGYHVLNNRDLTDRQQVRGLLQKIDTMTERNQGFYINEMYEWAQKTSWEQFWEILKDCFYAVIAFFQNF